MIKLTTTTTFSHQLASTSHLPKRQRAPVPSTRQKPLLWLWTSRYWQDRLNIDKTIVQLPESRGWQKSGSHPVIIVSTCRSEGILCHSLSERPTLETLEALPGRHVAHFISKLPKLHRLSHEIPAISCEHIHYGRFLGDNCEIFDDDDGGATRSPHLIYSGYFCHNPPIDWTVLLCGLFCR